MRLAASSLQTGRVERIWELRPAPRLDSTVSEGKAQSQLKLSREIGLRCDLPERTAPVGNTGTVEERGVEGIQRLATELGL